MGRKRLRELVSYGLDRIDHAQHIGIHLIEAGPHILPALPPRLSEGARQQLGKLKVTVHTNARVAEQHDAWLIVDDAHGFGVLGAQGRGSLAHFGLRSERLIYMGTLGKAAGLGGAFVAAHPTLIDWLVQTARPYIYTTAAPPAVAHALRESLRLIGGEEGDQRRARLQQRIAQLRGALSALIEAQPRLSWRLADSATAIQPLIVGDNAAALALAAALDAQGLWVPAIRPPTVPAGTARLRITLSAAHSADDVQRLVDGLAQAAKELA